MVTAVGLTYITGVLIHALREGLVAIARSAHGRFSERHKSRRRPWYRRRSGETADELAYYFWYMRATCANLAAAGLMLAVGSFAGRRWELGCGLMLLAFPFTWLAFQFDRGLYSCLE